jgi:hypothetical protein
VPVRAVARGEDVEVLTQPAVQELGHLAGHSERRVEWLVRAPAGATVVVEATQPKAGSARREASLP